MRKMTIGVIIVIITNIVIALAVRYIHGGRMTVREGVELSDCMTTNYLIAGAFSQPEVAYGQLQLPRGRAVYLRYSNLGFNVARASEQLYSLIADKNNFSEEPRYGYDNVFGISIGAAIAQNGVAAYLRVLGYSPEVTTLQANTARLRVYAINPCPGREFIEPKARKAVMVWAPVLEVLSAALGCLSFLPLFPVAGSNDAERYSLTLVADQMMALGYGPTAERRASGLILSVEDQFLLNDRLFEFYWGGNGWRNWPESAEQRQLRERIERNMTAYVHTPHGETANQLYAPIYEEAIWDLHKKLNTTVKP